MDKIDVNSIKIPPIQTKTEIPSISSEDKKNLIDVAM